MLATRFGERGHLGDARRRHWRFYQHEPAHALGLFDRKAQRDQRAPTVADDIDGLVASERREVARHGSHVVSTGDLLAATVAAQIINQHAMISRQGRRSGEVPRRQTADQKAVNHHHRRTRAEFLNVELQAVGSYLRHDAMNSTSSPTVSVMI